MKYLSVIITILSMLCLHIALPLSKASAVAPPPVALPSGISIAQLKITGDEFIVLQNNTNADIADMSVYWLQSFNNTNPLTAGASTSSQQFPATSLDIGETLLLSAGSRATCGASVVGKLSLSLTDSGGFLQVVRLAQNARGAVEQTPGDIVSWSSGNAGLIPSVPSSTKSPQGMFYRYKTTTGAYNWQSAEQDGVDNCRMHVLTTAGVSTTKQVVDTGILPATDGVPFTVEAIDAPAADDTGTGVASIPAMDVGLQSPQLSEILPNPVGTGNDATDEYIELYNPNNTVFDLSGFKLVVGITTQRRHTFPAGTVLAPKEFKAFYSSDTKISMSNTSGQAALLDPFDEPLSSTDQYKSAKDGQAWAVMKDVWSWTTELTPNKANIIKAPVAKAKKAVSSKKKLKPKTIAIKNAAGKPVKTASNASTSYVEDITARPVHVWVLATVALLAVLYAAYEYRHDIANRLHRLKTKLTSRGTDRE